MIHQQPLGINMKKLIFLLALLYVTLSSNCQIIRLGLIADPPGTPTITTFGSLSNFTSTANVPSGAQTFSITGTTITAGATATSPGTWLELSLDNSTWSSSVFATASNGILIGQPVTIYARSSSAATVGSYSGNINVTSPGATTRPVAASATISGGVTADDTLNVNIYDASGGIGIYTNAAYNNFSPPAGSTTNQTSATLNYASGISSGMTMTFTNNPSTTNGFYVDNGGSYASGTTNPYGYPQIVFRSVFTYNDDGPDSLVFNSVPAATNGYSVIIASSRSTATARPQTIVINGSTVSGGFDAQNNFNNLIRLDGVTPVGGKIVIILTSPTQSPGNRFTFVNAATLIKHNH